MFCCAALIAAVCVRYHVTSDKVYPALGWNMLLTLTPQTDTYDCTGIREVFSSKQVQHSLGDIGRNILTSSTSLTSSAVHSTQRVGREFGNSTQWNQGINGLRLSVPLLCALAAAGVVKGVESFDVDEIVKSLF